MNNYDVIIVGGGAAGLTAALVLLRARRSVAVVDSGAPRNAPAAHMHGYLSREGMAPSALLSRGRAEITDYGATLIDGEVVDIAPGFTARLSDGTALTARIILISTGLSDEVPLVPGVSERWGRDVLHCPYCHGYEVQDEPIGVLGGTPDAVAHALLLRQWSDDVVHFSHTDTLTAEQEEALAARGVTTIPGAVARLVVEDDRLRGVELVNGTVVPRSAVFVRPRLIPNGGLLISLGCEMDERGWVRHDAAGRTSRPGVYVAGNAADPRAQVITAAGQGSAAAIAINTDLVEEEIAHALATSRAR
ncbi:NAD(P)/FAD-dependent oxidoreductase [Microbacterium sp. NPDC056003]|uniref:NAD(P)/FAD-dependent oxidoreductase n=1 Tax=Microbacterium sp. NPDC056003 TaxID=3345676 RepID=UPI0035D7EA79